MGLISIIPKLIIFYTTGINSQFPQYFKFVNA